MHLFLLRGGFHHAVHLFILLKFLIICRINIRMVNFSCLIDLHFFFVINFFDGKLYSADFQNITLLNVVFLVKIWLIL